MGFSSDRSRSIFSGFTARLVINEPIDIAASQKSHFAQFLTDRESLRLLEELINQKTEANRQIRQALASAMGGSLEGQTEVQHLFVQRDRIDQAIIRIMDDRGERLEKKYGIDRKKLSRPDQDAWGVIRIDGPKSKTTVDIGFGAHTKTYAHLMTYKQRQRAKRLEAEARTLDLKQRMGRTYGGEDNAAAAGRQAVRETLFGPPETWPEHF